MPISLRDVLDDPSLAAGDPLLLAGERGLSGLVRWVHTSEVFEIADLLRGGELLLIGGVSLATATEAERRRYIGELAARRVAGLAIETGRRLPRIPTELIEDAERLGLPLIELRKVVPFVSVTESINGRLVNESVRRLQLADRVSHALASALADGRDPDELLDVLAAEIDADIELISVTGAQIARSTDDADHPRSSGAITAPVTTAGVTVATLVLYPRRTSDPVMLDAARDRAPEALGVALLRSRPLSHLERYAREFLGLARSGSRPSPRFTELTQLLGIAEHGPWVGVIARLGEHHLHTSGIEDMLRRGGRLVISHLHEDSYLAVVALGGGALGAGRADVVAALRTAPLARGVRVVVGPGTRSISGLSRCLHEAEACFDLTGSESDPTIDAADLSVERLLAALDRTGVIADFIDEHLGELIDLDTRTHGTAIDTLSSYFRHLGSKTDTASALHIQRQSLYQRLNKMTDVLGDVSPGSSRLASLMIAVELEAARRRGH